MPSQICHILAGRDALAKARRSIPPLLEPVFAIGCQGPDIFSHNRRTRPFALTYARALHRRGYGTFCRYAAEHLVRFPDPVKEAWLYGFVTHQAVDRTVHPYIVYRSAVKQSSCVSGVSPGLYHAFMERILDVMLLLKLRGERPEEFLSASMLLIDVPAVPALTELIAAALRSCYPDKTVEDSLLEKRIGNAFEDALFLYRITDPFHTSMQRPANHESRRRLYESGQRGVALLYPELTGSSVDWLNEHHGTWRNPASGQPSTKSVLDLFHDGVEAAAGVITCLSGVLAGETDASVLEERIGNGCLSIQNDDGSIAPAEYTDPFDLPAELTREYELRKVWVSAVVDRPKDELVL